MYVVFNELCQESALIKNNTNLKESMDLFVQFLIKVYQKKLVEGIVTIDSIWAGDNGNYLFQHWLKDPHIDQEYKRFFLTYMGKYLTYIDTKTLDGEFCVNIKGKSYPGIGCTFAHETNDVVISIATNDIWKEEHINGTYNTINDDDCFASQEAHLININEQTNLEKVGEIARMHEVAKISSGCDLWEQRENIYPNLIFCESVKTHLEDNPEKYHILKIMEKLDILQKYFSQKHDLYNPEKLELNARTESESVKTNPELKRQRLFKLPTGEQVYFYDHISFTGKFSGGRIYFYPVIKEQKCYIGYIGQHLSTQKYKV